MRNVLMKFSSPKGSDVSGCYRFTVLCDVLMMITRLDRLVMEDLVSSKDILTFLRFSLPFKLFCYWVLIRFVVADHLHRGERERKGNFSKKINKFGDGKSLSSCLSGGVCTASQQNSWTDPPLRHNYESEMYKSFKNPWNKHITNHERAVSPQHCLVRFWTGLLKSKVLLSSYSSMWNSSGCRKLFSDARLHKKQQKVVKIDR